VGRAVYQYIETTFDPREKRMQAAPPREPAAASSGKQRQAAASSGQLPC